MEIRTENPLRLLKLAWHLGNRHVPAEITPEAIYIAEDHVLIEMVRGLGASATVVERPFRPERGAYHQHGPEGTAMAEAVFRVRRGTSGELSDPTARRPAARPQEPNLLACCFQTQTRKTSPPLIAGLDPAIQPSSRAESLDARVEPGHEAEQVDSARAGVEPAENLLPLFAWLSPGFPVGAYAYSHALEWAAEAGDIADEASLAEWLTDILEHGAGRNDAILFACAHRAAAAERPGRARRNERARAGDGALARAAARDLPAGPQLPRRGAVRLADRRDSPRSRRALDGEIAYPVAVGAAAAAHGMPLRPALEAFLLAFAQNLVSAAIRLAPIGQTAGMRMVAALAPAASRLAAECEALDLDDIGGCTFRADLGSFLHETQYTRLFRS